ncbi:BON domain-containing protein [Streptomyces sp. NPDC086669]|uniref:BON domain-containing protein n=1 Tax=Streptomyces sp. NPDC086669 TaxID=3365753 RepID=UPI0037FF9915
MRVALTASSLASPPYPNVPHPRLTKQYGTDPIRRPSPARRPGLARTDDGRQARSSHSGPPPDRLGTAAQRSAVQVQVLDGVVRLRGRIRDASLVPAAAQLVRAAEGVVDVYCELTAQDAPAV